MSRNINHNRANRINCHVRKKIVHAKLPPRLDARKFSSAKNIYTFTVDVFTVGEYVKWRRGERQNGGKKITIGATTVDWKIHSE